MTDYTFLLTPVVSGIITIFLIVVGFLIRSYLNRFAENFKDIKDSFQTINQKIENFSKRTEQKLEILSSQMNGQNLQISQLQSQRDSLIERTDRQSGRLKELSDEFKKIKQSNSDKWESFYDRFSAALHFLSNGTIKDLTSLISNNKNK